MIGTIAAVLTTLSFLPQAYQVIKNQRYFWYLTWNVYNVCHWCFFMDYPWMEYSRL